MLSSIRKWILVAARLPHEPHAPAGAPGSVRVFGAAKNYFYLSLAGWIVSQLAAAFGIVISITLLWRLENDIRRIQETEPRTEQTIVVPRSDPPNLPLVGRIIGNARLPPELARKLAPHADLFFPLIVLIEAFGIIAFLSQLVVTGLARRLVYEMRWYIVTDRSLRIRTGIWDVRETTMSFANLQQVLVSQGPLQRVLGIADVHVRSAGGGNTPQGQHGTDESMHESVFHGVNNAAEIRDLIVARLREYRDSGLGDTDEAPSGPSARMEAETTGAQPSQGTPELIAARELLAEAKALRVALTAG